MEPRGTSTDWSDMLVRAIPQLVETRTFIDDAWAELELATQHLSAVDVARLSRLARPEMSDTPGVMPTFGLVICGKRKVPAHLQIM